MKLSRVLYLFAAVALPPLARADAPLSPQALGALQGVVDFCAKVDPKDSKKLGEHASQLERGLSASTIAADKSTDAYKQAYQTLSTVLKEWPADDALANCRSVAVAERDDTPLRPRPHPRPEDRGTDHSQKAAPSGKTTPSPKVTQSRSAPPPPIERMEHGPGSIRE